MKFLRDLQSLLTALCGLTLVAGFVFGSPWLSYLSVAFGSYFALKAAYAALRERHLDVNFLMVFAAAGAVIVARPAEAATLLFLFSLSSTLEAFALSRTTSAIEALIKLRPEQAYLVLETGEKTVAVADLKVGDTVRVRPFDQIPVDGTVSLGSTSVNQAAMTGESEPVFKHPGDRVFAGTQNLEGVIEFQVSAAVGDTTLERIVDLVREAQENKASGERISSWFGERYTLFVIGAFVVSLAARLVLREPVADAFYASLTLLVALSPCALVISTPASTLSALAFAGRNGMLIRGGEFIEAAGRVTAVALDKTGTLTQGKFRLAEICICNAPVAIASGGAHCLEADACWHGAGDLSDEAKSILRIAASVEQYSSHPIAEAIVSSARTLGIEIPEALQSIGHPGLGVEATVDDAAVRVGQRRFFEEGGASLPPDFIDHVEAVQQMGMTAVIVERGGKLAALGLRDEPRPDARQVLDQLRALGIARIAMLTGDHREAAHAVATEIGITEVHAGLMPQAKAEIVAQMASRGSHVMMVGDGINDAPVLSMASVGVAMGGLGSDVALNAADVVLMQDKLARLPTLIKLGRMTNRVIRANLLFAAGVIVFLTIGTLVSGMIFPNANNLILPFAVVGHEGSTVVVILNGLRLLKGPSQQT